MNFIIAIYNKLDDDSPYRSDIFDLFGTPDRLNLGLVGTRDGKKFKSLYWDWGLNGIKKVCKFIYWRHNNTLDGFECWYHDLNFSTLPKLMGSLFYVFKYGDKKIAAFVASVNRMEKKGGRLWFEFTPEKFVMLPPDFMIDYRKDFFSDGREDSEKWNNYFEKEYGLSDAESALQDIFSSAATQDQYHIIPTKYIDKWVEEQTDYKVTTKPLFIGSVVDNKKLLLKDLPTMNQVFWSVFSQYTGRTQVRGSFSIIVKGTSYSVTDIPVNAFTEKGYVYYHEVGVPYALFQVLNETLDLKAYDSFQQNEFLNVEFHNKTSISLHESHFLKKAEKVCDIATNYNQKFKSTDYDYVLDLNPLGINRKIAFDLSTGLWYKGFGKSKLEFVHQWLHNLVEVPLKNPGIITLWHYGLLNYEPFEGLEIGQWLIKKSGIKPGQYLYLDKAQLSQGKITIPDDIRVILLPLYDNDSDYINLKNELKYLNPQQNMNKVKSSGFYKISNSLVGHLLK